MRDLFGARPGSEIDRIAREWVQRVALRQMTAAQADALRQWCQADPRHGAAFAEAHRLWQGMAPAAALSEARGRERRLSRPARRALGAGLACAATGAGVAVVAPPFGLWPSWRNWAPTIAPPRASSAASYCRGRRAGSEHAHQHRAARRRRRADQRRGRDLAGRREQSVHRQRGRRRVMARDAVFELRHTDGSVCVTCLSGAVEVALASGGATLAAAQRLVYDAAGLQPARALDADDLPAWREGFLRFRQAPLAQVLDEINRYRSGRVILMAQSLAARPVSVRVELARLDTAIAQIRENFQLDATALPGGVLLLG